MSLPFAFFLFLSLQAPLLFSITTLQTFQINLDLPPEQRWKDVILSKKTYIQQYTQMALQQLQKTDLSGLLLEIEQDTFFKDSDFSKEMLGIAQYAGMKYSEIFLMNFMYETFAGCTSIVFENSNGDLFLGHNLDYFFTVPIAKSIVQLEFYSGGSLLFKGQSVAGQIGVFTGLKPNGYALTLNQRSKFSSGDLVSRLRSLFSNEIQPVIYNMRQGLEKTETFEEIVDQLSKVELGSGCYFILSGTGHNEGIVITRSQDETVDSSRLTMDSDNGWFLVQTNSDRDLPDYQKVDVRRYQAEQRVMAMGKSGVDGQRILNEVLSLSPNKNSLTILSSILEAKSGDFETVMWV